MLHLMKHIQTRQIVDVVYTVSGGSLCKLVRGLRLSEPASWTVE